MNDSVKIKAKYGEAEILSQLRDVGQLDKKVQELEDEVIGTKAAFHARQKAVKARRVKA